VWAVLRTCILQLGQHEHVLMPVAVQDLLAQCVIVLLGNPALRQGQQAHQAQYHEQVLLVAHHLLRTVKALLACARPQRAALPNIVASLRTPHHAYAGQHVAAFTGGTGTRTN
jgi:hypothetical protein